MNASNADRILRFSAPQSRFAIAPRPLPPAPLSATRAIFRFSDRSGEGVWRSKEAGGGAAAPCLLRNPPPPPAWGRGVGGGGWRGRPTNKRARSSQKIVPRPPGE